MKKTILVLFGGLAASETLKEAAEVVRAIPRGKYEVVPVGITHRGRWLFYPGDPDNIADGSWETDADCVSAILSPDPIHRGLIKAEGGLAAFTKIDLVFPLVQGKGFADGKIQSLLDLSSIPYVGKDLLVGDLCDRGNRQSGVFLPKLLDDIFSDVL